MPGTIISIPATKKQYTLEPLNQTSKKKVAAYARVSTDVEEQQNSYEAQIKYYKDYIKNRDDWEYVDVYADEGISGTRTFGREGFNRMISDALAGKINLIITKSVSRFARNTVDSLSTIRELKAKGIEVYFEKENIYTLDTKGELMLTIMSSLAQEESRSISENITWGLRRAASEGKFSIGYAHFLGYDKGMKVNEEQARIVQRIFREFLAGKSPSTIARMLTADGILTPTGKETWRANVVRSILTNEKYKGDALIQKTFTTDFLTHACKKNDGEVPQYYVMGNHEPIIAPEVFDAVQEEVTLRQNEGIKHYTPHAFSGKVFCGDCGGIYGSKSGRYTTAWRCNRQHKHITDCRTHQITNGRLEDAFVKAFNRLLEKKDEVIQLCEQVMAERYSTYELDRTIEEKKKALAEFVAGERKMIVNAGTEAKEKYAETKEQEAGMVKELQALNKERAIRTAKKGAIGHYLAELKAKDRIVEFDEALMRRVVDRIVVKRDGLRFEFRGGQVIEG